MINPGAVFSYKVSEDGKGTCLQMFTPQTANMLKSLHIPPNLRPTASAGEAWIETNGDEVVCCIPLEAGNVTGRVVEVSGQFYRIEVDGQQGRFPLQWATAPQAICINCEVSVNVRGQQLCAAPGARTSPPLQIQSSLPAAVSPEVLKSAPIPLPAGRVSLPAIQPTANSLTTRPPSCIEVTEAMKAEFHRPSEEDFQRRTPELAKTIGRHRLPIEILQEEFKWNSVIMQKFQMLSQPYSAWRRSKGDGNSFYRCLGVLLLEHYCRPDTPLQEFYTVYSEIIQQNRHFNLSLANEQDFRMFKLFIMLLKDLYILRSKGENAFRHLQYCLQRSSIDKAMIVTMRHYTASYLQLNSQHPDITPFIGNLPTLLAEITEFGKEADGTALLAATRCYSVILHIVTVDSQSKSIIETVCGPESKDRYPSFSLLRLPDRYNYLIRREVHEADRYDFASNAYTPTPTGQLVGYELFPR